MKNRKIVVIAFLVVAVMLLGVGYAALTDTLTIIGNAHIDIDKANATFDEKIYFSVAEPVSSTGTGTTADVAGFTPDAPDDATFTVNKLAVVGEKSVFRFVITNDSNVDAKITIAPKKLSGVDNPSNTNTDKFTVEYAYETDSEGNIIVESNGGTTEIIVTVTVKNPVTSATSASFGIEYTATTVE